MLGQMPGDIGLTDDADHSVVLDHGQSPHLMLFHDHEHLLDIGIAVDVVGVALSQLTGGDGGGILAGGKAFDDDVSVGDHAMQAIVVAADRQRTDAQVAHVLSGRGEGFVLTDTGRTGVHDVAGGGHDLLLESSRGGEIPLAET
jgi:hypothetical protein